MVDLESYCAAAGLKLARDLLTSDLYSWHPIEQFVITDLNIEVLFHCHKISLRSKIFTQIPFKSIKLSLYAWQAYRSKTNLLNQTTSCPLWLNKDLKTFNLSICNNPFIKAGIFEIYHLVDASCKLKSYDQICVEFNMPRSYRAFSTYNKLSNCTQSSVLANAKCSSFDEALSRLAKTHNNFKSMYNVYLEAVALEPTAPHSKYANEITSAQSINWSSHYLQTHFCTLENRLRAFQWKINVRALPLNYHLHKIGVVPNPNCTFCDLEPETIVHLFAQCKQLDAFWEMVYDFTLTAFPLLHNIDESNQLFGIDSHPNSCSVNCLLLCARYVIYKHRFLGTIPTFGSLIAFLKEIRTTEYIIALNKNKLELHNKKWLFIR